MGIMDAATLSGFARNSAESVSDFAGVVRNLILDIRDSYRPGVPCVRGPGPKWRAKHQPWSRFSFEVVLPDGQRELSAVHVRQRDAADLAR
jgi:hypothetical protein